MNSTNYIFSDRQTYLEAAAAWKANYITLTTEARRARAEFNQAQSDESKARLAYYRAARSDEGPTLHKEWRTAIKRVDDARLARYAIKCDANRELADRAEMKDEARKQWEAAKLQPV